MRFYHHSRDINYRNPPCAAQAASKVTIAADIFGCDDARVYLRVITPYGEQSIAMERRGHELLASFTLPNEPCLCHYDFCIITGNKTLYYGGYSGEGRLMDYRGDCFQITVYNSGKGAPDWFCQGIAYQIFPDRFCRSSLNAAQERAKQHTCLNRTVSLHADWSEEPKYMGKDGADYAPNDYFGGDLKGIADKLDYLKGLGVSCIYLNPIFEADSNHRYNTADYRTIDPLLGTERDFITLVQQAGERGIRLILDGVFSHTGADSIYFNRNGSYHTVGAYQGSASPYYSWYSFKGSRDEYDCWWGFKTLPNVNEMDQGYRSFICGKEGVLAKWQRLGAGGWRLDVADELPDEFIKELNAAVKRNDADAMVLGEVWEDCSNKCGPQGRRAYVNGGVLDGAMNYPFRRAVLDYLCGKTDAYGCNNALQTLASNYPRRFLRGCINLLGSHDEIRPLSYLGTDGDLEGLSRAEQAKVKLDEKALSLGKKRLLCAMALMLVAEGVPCIYYGDEVGMEGLKDPFNRRTFPWGGGDGELYSSIAKLTAIRSGSLALKQGYTRMGALNKSVFCIIRFLNDEVVVAVFNNSSAPKRVIVQPSLLFEGEDAQRPLSLCGLYDDVFGGTVAAESIMELEVEANGFKVLRKKA